MVFTKKDLEEIRRALAVMGVRDTDLPEAYPLTGNEEVAIVQGLENRRVKIGDIFGKYLEGLLPYVGQGESAYQIAVRYGFEGTEEEWIQSLNAAITIVENYGGGRGKAASAEDVKLLKMALDTLSGKALTKDDLKSFNVNDPTKPLSAKAGYDLWNMIKNLSPGSGVEIINNLNSNRTDAALSANMGRVLANMIEELITLNNGIEKIYTWAEFQNLAQEPEDKIGLLANAKTIYNLFSRIKVLQEKVAALEEKSSDVPGGDTDDGTTYVLRIASDDNVREINATGTTQLRAFYEKYVNSRLISSTEVTAATNPDILWTTDNRLAAEVVNGLVTGKNTLTSKQTVSIRASYAGVNSSPYELTVRKVGGDDQPAAEPYITVSPNPITVDSDGNFIIGDSAADNYLDVTITVNNSTDTWKLAEAQSYNWFRAEKYGDVLRLSNVDAAVSRDGSRTSDVNICLSNDETVTAKVTVSQLPIGYENIDFRIFLFGDDGTTSYVFPKDGDDILLVLQAPAQWRLETSPSWAVVGLYSSGQESISQIGSNYVGQAGETILRVKVGECEESSILEPIRCKLIDGSKQASFYIAQDVSLINSIKLIGEDGMKHVSVSHTGFAGRTAKLRASGSWTAVIPDNDWIKFMVIDGCDYTISADGLTAYGTSTNSEWIDILLDREANDWVYGRTVWIKASLNNDEASSWCAITQFGTEEGNYDVYFEPAHVGEEGGYANLVCRRADGRIPSWYVFINYNKYGYDLPEGIEFQNKDIRTGDAFAGYTAAVCTDNSPSGLKVRILPLEGGEESRDISVRVNLAEGLLPRGYVVATIHQEASAPESSGDGDEPIAPANTLSANIVGNSNISSGDTSVTVHVQSTTSWTAQISNDATLSAYNSTYAGGNTADIIATVGSNSTTSSRSFTVTILSDDPDCTPDSTVQLTISQSGTVTRTVPSSVELGASADSTTTAYIKSSVAWKIRKKETSGLFSGYALPTTSGSATSGTHVQIRTYPAQEYTSDQTGTIIFSQLINGTYTDVAEITVVKRGVTQVGTISVSTSSVSIAPDGNTSSPSVVDVSVSPYGASWHASVISGNTGTLACSADTALNKLSIYAAATGSSRSWTVRVYLDGTEEYADISVSQAQPSVSASFSTSAFPASGNQSAMTRNMTVTANCAWTLSKGSDDTWISLGQNSGSAGSTTVAVTISSNSDTEIRMGSITVAAVANSGINQSFTVTQLPAAPATPVISQDGNQVTITCATQGAAIFYKYKTTGSYSAYQSYASAISISEDTTLVAYSEKYDVISAYTEEFLAEYDGGSVVPTQHELSIDKRSASVGSGGGTLTIVVTSNVTWSATASSGIVLSGDTDNVVGDGVITVTYPANTTLDGISRWVKVSADDSALDVMDQICNISQAGITVVTFRVQDAEYNDVTSLVFGPNEASKKIYVTCNTNWSASVDVLWANVYPDSGAADMTVEVTVSKLSSSQIGGTLTIVGLGGSTKTISVSQGMIIQ